jgi:hypothetical protein
VDFSYRVTIQDKPWPPDTFALALKLALYRQIQHPGVGMAAVGRSFGTNGYQPRRFGLVMNEYSHVLSPLVLKLLLYFMCDCK